MFDQIPILDLSPAERRAYESLINDGPMSPPQLAKAASLTRVNSYAALRGLAQKGLAREKDINKKLTYYPEPPTKLQELAKEKAEQTHLGLSSIEALIPSLMHQYSLVSELPGVTYYEGIEEVKQVYENTLKAKPEEILVIRSIYDNKHLDRYISKYIRRRAKLGIKTRLVGPYYEIDFDNKKLLYERRYYPKKNFLIPAQISIYQDKVSIISLKKEMVATVIQSKDIATTFRIIFEVLWTSAKEYD